MPTRKRSSARRGSLRATASARKGAAPRTNDVLVNGRGAIRERNEARILMRTTTTVVLKRMGLR